MGNSNQKIKGNNNIQVGGDFVKTDKVVKKTEVIHNSNEHITSEQQYEIKTLIDKLVQMLSSSNKENTSHFYSREWTTFKKQFKIPSYKVLKKEDYKKAIQWLSKRIAYLGRPKLRKTDNSQYRKELYKGIYARGKQLGMEKQDIIDFAIKSLNIKNSITSLKELSDTRLKKLNQKIFNKKL